MKQNMKKKLAFCITATLLSTATFAADAKLSLVSSGTGDLDNMTLKAYNTIKEADIIFTMRGEAGKFEELIGDKPVYPAGHALFSKSSKSKWMKLKNEKGETIEKTAEEIVKIEDEYKKLIRTTIKDGKNVVIIDNGDPTIFGPHIYFLKEFEDLNPKLIPGISSFNAANAALQRSIVAGGKNLRGVTLTVGNSNNQLIEKLAPTGSTMVFFMDRKFKDFIAHLRKHYTKETRIAIVMDAGDSKKEKVVLGNLENITTKITQEKIPFNHLVYVGDFL